MWRASISVLLAVSLALGVPFGGVAFAEGASDFGGEASYAASSSAAVTSSDCPGDASGSVSSTENPSSDADDPGAGTAGDPGSDSSGDSEFEYIGSIGGSTSQGGSGDSTGGSDGSNSGAGSNGPDGSDGTGSDGSNSGTGSEWIPGDNVSDQDETVQVHYFEQYLPAIAYASSPEEAEPIVYVDEIREEHFTTDLPGPDGAEYLDWDSAAQAMFTGLLNHESSVNVKFYIQGSYYQGLPMDMVYAGLRQPSTNLYAGDYLEWLYGGSSVSGSTFTNASYPGLTFLNLTFSVKWHDTHAQEALFRSDFESFMDSWNLTGTKYQQVLAIYQYLVDHVSYDYDHPDTYKQKYSAYAAFENGEAVCQGFSTLFYLMCRYQGIDVRVITGQANGGSHAWNIVQMDDSFYYNLDATWDTGKSRSNWGYFLLNNANFVKHQRYGTGGATPSNSRSLDYLSTSFVERYPVGPVNYAPPVTVQPGWVKIDGNWYYRNADGTYKTGLYNNGTNTYYFQSNGAMLTGWKKIDGSWYYFDPDESPVGHMVTGWKKINGEWYFFMSSGAMVKGKCKISGNYYYFNGDGEMQTGWVKWSNGTWSYFDPDESPVGHMVTGWKKVGSYWYWMNSDGIMATGWRQINSKWYYFRAGGSMVTGWQEWSDGTWSKFDSSGVAITGWIKSGDYWYYADPSTRKTVTGWRTIGSYKYYFYSSGKMATGTVTISGTTYKFDSSGHLVS